MDEETDFRGVVRDGQVVLDEPLNLPDGTEVSIEAVPPARPQMTMTDEQFRVFTEFFTGRNRDMVAWAKFEAEWRASQEAPAVQPRTAS